VKCNKCGTELKKPEDIGYSQSGTMTYKVSVYTHGVSKGELYYDQDEFNSNDGGEWYCQNCNEDLPLTFDQGEKLFVELSEKKEVR